jgi:hypothetical protein
MKMNNTEFENLRKSVEDTFTSLYVIDVSSLSADQRKQHQELLSAAYLAVIRLENRSFENLTNDALSRLGALSARARDLQEQLAGFKNAIETLRIVASALNVLTTIAELLK